MPTNYDMLLGKLGINAKPLLDELEKVGPAVDRVLKVVEKLNGQNTTSTTVRGFNELGQAVQTTAKIMKDGSVSVVSSITKIDESIAKIGKNKALSEMLSMISRMSQLETRMMALPIDSHEYAAAGQELARLRSEYARLDEYLRANPAATAADFYKLEQKRTEEINKQNIAYAKQQDELENNKKQVTAVEKATEAIWRRLVSIAAIRAISTVWREA